MEAHELKAAANAATAARADAARATLVAEEYEMVLEQQMAAAKAALLDAKRYEPVAAQALLAIPEAERSTAAGRAAQAERRNAAGKVATTQEAVDELAERARYASFASHSARERAAEAWGAEQNALAALDAFLQQDAAERAQ